MKNKRVARERVGPLKDEEENLCVAPEEVGEILDKYFVSVFTKEKELVEDDLREGNVEFLSQVAMTKEEMLCGSVLGPLLFVVYINDLEENVAGLINKFADQTKIGGVVDSEEDCQRIQQNIEQLEAWAEKWQMEFNLDKCELMYFGRSST
eukprot:g32134.t1